MKTDWERLIDDIETATFALRGEIESFEQHVAEQDYQIDTLEDEVKGLKEELEEARRA